MICIYIIFMYTQVSNRLDRPHNKQTTHTTRSHESTRAGGGRGRGRSGRVPLPPLLPLSIVFCLTFSDLVGQGTMFLYYAKRVFHWTPDTLGCVDW